jgi:hypothetical protein
VLADEGLDLPLIVGLLNRIAIDRGIPSRYVQVATGSAAPVVSWADASAVEAAVGEGLLLVEP